MKKYEFASHFFTELNNEFVESDKVPDKLFLKYVEDDIIIKDDFSRVVKKLTRNKRIAEGMEEFFEEVEEEIPYSLVRNLLNKYKKGKKCKFKVDYDN